MGISVPPKCRGQCQRQPEPVHTPHCLISLTCFWGYTETICSPRSRQMDYALIVPLPVAAPKKTAAPTGGGSPQPFIQLATPTTAFPKCKPRHCLTRREASHSTLSLEAARSSSATTGEMPQSLGNLTAFTTNAYYWGINHEH